jgi:hypothetical protein
MKISVFWDVKSCSLIEVHQNFSGTYCLQLQGGRVSQISNKQDASCFSVYFSTSEDLPEVWVRKADSRKFWANELYINARNVFGV